MTYTVTPNDSIDSIAETFQVPVSELMSMNGLGPNSRLIPGMVIIIPPVNPRPPRPPGPPRPPQPPRPPGPPGSPRPPYPREYM